MITKSPSPETPELRIVDSRAHGPLESRPVESDIERRRLPRLNLTTEQFRLGANGKIFSVADISSEGLALRVLDRSDLVLFPVEMLCEGTLNLSRQKFACSVRVKHVGTERIGCRFEDIGTDLRQALDKLLDPNELGRELKPVPAVEPGTVWYQGPTGTHLLLSRGMDGQFFRLALFFLGNFVRWEEAGGLSTGRVSSAFEPSEVRGVVRFETMLFDADPQPDHGKLQVAKKILLGSNLPKDLISWCARQMQEPQTH